MSVIINTDMNINRVAVYTYINMFRGLNNRLLFSVPKFLNFFGFKSDSHPGGVNEKVISTLDGLTDMGYLVYCDKPSKTAAFEIKVNTDVCRDACENDFAMLYIDEIEKVIDYRRDNIKDTKLNSFTNLLLFAYIRRKIFRRPNLLQPEERYPEKIEERKHKIIEAYNTTFKDIANGLKISERVVSKATDNLVRLKLIVVREAFHVHDETDKYYTPDCIFANYEKREGPYLLDAGYDYANEEIERKAEQINKKSVLGYKLKVGYKYA